MTIHIGAKPGDIAETVLLPGDPYRAKWAAETFLDDVRLVNETRGMLGFTGTWRGNRVTIQGSGMGMPSLSIYVNELIRDFDAQTLIRIGSAGAMQGKRENSRCRNCDDRVNHVDTITRFLSRDELRAGCRLGIAQRGAQSCDDQRHGGSRWRDLFIGRVLR